MSIAVKKVRQDPNGDVLYGAAIEKETAKTGGKFEVVLEHTTLSVALQAGMMQEGTRIRMKGAGDKPIGHGPPGDVYLEFSIQKDVNNAMSPAKFAAIGFLCLILTVILLTFFLRGLFGKW